jgi:hypothetical protein
MARRLMPWPIQWEMFNHRSRFALSGLEDCSMLSIMGADSQSSESSRNLGSFWDRIGYGEDIVCEKKRLKALCSTQFERSNS